jgi:hypothetical protein
MSLEEDLMEEEEELNALEEDGFITRDNSGGVWAVFAKSIHLP